MNTKCTAKQLEFKGCGRRRVVASFDGGHISSDGGVVLLRELDNRLRITQRFAACFQDNRNAGYIEHSVLEMVRQRVFALAQGYEDLNDHDTLRLDPLLAVAAGKKDPLGQDRKREQDKGKALCGKSTLNRLEHCHAPDDRYRKITCDGDALEALFPTLFLESFSEEPAEIVLDFDSTDDPLHGKQEGRFFHGYYRNYCYLPLYVFCGDQLLVARLRTADRDASAGSVEILAALVALIRARWPNTRIIVRADSGFAREELMAFCEQKELFYLLGLAKNTRLLKHIEAELAQAKELFTQTGQAARVFGQFQYKTLKTWSVARRVIGKAEHLEKGANPRFIVTNLPEEYADAKTLYEKHYCARGDMENRIKEQQLYLFADRTSTTSFKANQMRLWLSSLAYTLIEALRRLTLHDTKIAKASSESIRLWLLKIGALVRVTARRVSLHLASACPYQEIFDLVNHRLRAMPMRC